MTLCPVRRRIVVVLYWLALGATVGADDARAADAAPDRPNVVLILADDLE